MLILLTTLVKSIWWDFNESELSSIIEHSIDHPLFVLCYSPYCPHCFGLPEQLIEYNKSKLGQRTDISMTMIDCFNNGRGCNHFHIGGTPSIALVLGKKYRYWPKTTERSGPGWDHWINEHIGPNLRQIFNDSQLHSAKLEPSDGGTTFYIQVSSSSDPIIPIISNISKHFRIYNDSFVYRIVPSIKAPIITAYFSEHCGHKYTYTGSRSKLIDFINEHKFGVFHRYDKEEFSKIHHSKRGVILLTDNELSDGQREALRLIPKNHCDSDIIYGWSNIKKDKKIMYVTGVKSFDIPLLYPTGFGKHHNFYKGKLSNVWDTAFMDDFRIKETIAIFLSFKRFIRSNYFLLLFSIISVSVIFLAFTSVFEIIKQDSSKFA